MFFGYLSRKIVLCLCGTTIGIVKLLLTIQKKKNEQEIRIIHDAMNFNTN